MKVYRLQTERVVTQPTFEEFSPIELQVPYSSQNLQKDSRLNLNRGEEWYRSMDHMQKDLQILRHR
jgi:hypothetical protein